MNEDVYGAFLVYCLHSFKTLEMNFIWLK